MDLVIDKDAFSKASLDMAKYCEDLAKLRSDIVSSFEQLRRDWDTDAGKKFFKKKLEENLLSNLDYYFKVFEHISQNLTAASHKYEEVFRAADIVADAQY